ncbi:MAG TPA: hypothetical protein VK636_00730, partial [Gemmatimonadaceae bacterium]|nr:hypothetical protein [Gemmatimonadaceae bacterium]
LFLTAPAALVAIALLSRTVASLLRTVRGSVVTSVPIRTEQRVTFEHDGDMVLNLDGRVLSRGAAGLRFALARVDSAGEVAVALRNVLFRTHVSSASRSRLELYSFTVPSAGAYLLRISGVDPATDYSADTVVFTRPFHGALVFHILSLIVLGIMLVGSLIVSGFALTSQRLAPAATRSDGIRRASTLESAIARSATIVRARTVTHGGPPRYQVLETLSGVVPHQIAGADQPEGLIVDIRAATAGGYHPVAGDEVILLLPAPGKGAERPSVEMVEPIAIFPLAGGRVVDAAGRDITLDELRRMMRR